jgi:hypothetical protein
METFGDFADYLWELQPGTCPTRRTMDDDGRRGAVGLPPVDRKMTGERDLDLASAFCRLAAEAGAREARPSSDGSVFFAYQDTARLHDGSVLFAVKGPKGRAALRWNPLDPDGPESVAGLPGSLSARGLTRDQVRRVGERIARFAASRVRRELRPFSVPREEQAEVELSEGFATTALGAFLDDGGVGWGPFRYEGCSATPPDTLSLAFESAEAKVKLEIRPAASVPAGDRDAWHPVPPLALRVAEDTRAPGRRSPEELVETYVLYALARSIAPGVGLVEAPPAPSAVEVPKSTGDMFAARDVAHPTAFFVEPLERSLGADLEAGGVTVDGFVIPSFRCEHVGGFARAAAAIVNWDKIIVGEIQEVREAWPELPVTEVDPPFGPAATAAFYREVAAASGASFCEDRLAALWAPHGAAWQALRERAAGHEVAIIVNPWEVDYLTKPETIYGLSLVSLLSEMGFRVRVVVLPGAGGDGPALVEALEAALGEEREGLTVQAEEPPEHPCDDVAASERLDALLRALPSSLVFTELPPDQRVLDAGRLSVHPRHFEPGFAGAVRTARRLVRLAESRFFACFGGAPEQRGLQCT